jgi:GNAT superfamily N-acetyltransferase
MRAWRRFYHQHIAPHGVEFRHARFPFDHAARETEDTAVVMVLVTEVCAWLAQRGIQQWPSPPGPDVRHLLAREIGAGEVYLAHLSDAVVIGMLRFEWHNAELWPNDPEGSGYVHSVMVSPGYRGAGAGAAMLRWAAEHVRARARQYLRLDCVAGNDTLRVYYERLGFRCCGIALHDGYRAALFELDLDQGPKTSAAPRVPA